jgi:hypothetical protein
LENIHTSNGGIAGKIRGEILHQERFTALFGGDWEMSHYTTTEHAEQVAVIAWARLQANAHPALEWIHAIPNGAKLPWRKNKNGKRYSPEAQKLKAEGLTPGIPDLFLPYPAQGYAGFYLEMKRPGNIEEVREGQKEFMAYCERAGYLAQVHDYADDAIAAIQWYLGMSE